MSRMQQSFNKPHSFAKPPMKTVQLITDGDTRTVEERIKALPFVRDEELPEWEEWAKYCFGIR